MAKLTLNSNAKFRRLCLRLRMDSKAHVRGHLDELWDGAHAKRSPVLGDRDDIEALADWPATRPRWEFADALIELGFVDEIIPGRVYAVHDYYDHAPTFIRKALARRCAEDCSVGPETYFMGIDAFRRLFEVHDEAVPGEILEAAAGEEIAAPAANNGGQWPTTAASGGQWEGKPHEMADNGGLSCPVLSRSTSPPIVPLEAGAQRRPGGRRGARRRPAAFEGLAEPAAHKLSAEEALAAMRAETIRDARTFGASSEALERLERAADAAELAAIFERAIRPHQPAAEAGAAP